jgi:tetratricopeptide (TPR) repeat protein
MNSSLEVAYQRLAPEAARLYRLIGVLPMGIIDGNGAAALLDCQVSQACGLLNSLADESRLVEESDSIDYRMPPEVCAHAAAIAHEDRLDQDVALTRYGEYLLASTTAAEERLTPSHRVLPRTYTFQSVRPASFADDSAALAWLGRYRERLATAVTYFAEAGAHTLVWQLADAMWPLFLRLRVPEVRAWVQQLGLNAARADGSTEAEGMFLTSLGGTALSDARIQEAVEHYTAAFELYEKVGNPRGIGQAANGLGKAALDLGDLETARAMFERSLTERTAAGYERGVYLSRQGLGRVALANGDAPAAADHFEASSQGLISIDDAYDGAWSLGWLALAIAMSGDFARADTLINRARTMMVECGSRYGQAGVEDLAAQVAEHRGDEAAVRLHLSAAAEHFAASDLRCKDQVLARLGRLDTLAE